MSAVSVERVGIFTILRIVADFRSPETITKTNPIQMRGIREAMMPTKAPEFRADVDLIRRHYDHLSYLYGLVWGEHLHHGYWTADETPERAQIQLMELLAQRARIPKSATVLDIGCGVGGSALWLAEQHGCRVTGITISPVQAKIATRKARRRGLNHLASFEVGDANQWQPTAEVFDVVWVMESSEHFPDKKHFIGRCAKALKPGGSLAICAWLKRDGDLRSGERELVDAIAEAMMSASLESLSSYREWMSEAGLVIIAAEDITSNVEATWERCTRVLSNPLLKLATRFTSGPTQRFVEAFPLMKKAYSSGAMAFGLFAATKPS